MIWVSVHGFSEDFGFFVFKRVLIIYEEVKENVKLEKIGLL